MRKVTRKGKVNGFEASDTLAMLGNDCSQCSACCS